MRTGFQILACSLMLGCGGESTSETPSAAEGAERAALREADEASATAEPPPEASPAQGTSTPTPSPRRLIATRGRARVELEEGGGILVDSNAPPPPPGSTPPRHATLHGSCGGDPLACSEAGTVVRRATTLEEVRAGLEPLGFTVTIAP
jgi:hypothetical protein